MVQLVVPMCSESSIIKTKEKISTKLVYRDKITMRALSILNNAI